MILNAFCRRLAVVLVSVFSLGPTACLRYKPVKSQAPQGKNLYAPTSSADLSEHIRTVLKISHENTAANDQRLQELLTGNPRLAEIAHDVAEKCADLDARRLLAAAYLEHGLHPHALNLYQEIREEVPGDLEAQLALARIWDAWGDFSFALQYAQRAVEVDQNSAQALEMLGRVRLHRGELDAAIGSFRAALRLAPESASLLANIGYALRLQKKWQEARLSLERAVEIDPTLPEARNNLGVVLAHLGEHEGALRQFMAINPPAAAFNNLGVIYLDQNQWQKAQNEFRQALKIDPHYGVAQLNLQETESRLPPPRVYHVEFSSGTDLLQAVLSPGEVAFLHPPTEPKESSRAATLSSEPLAASKEPPGSDAAAASHKSAAVPGENTKNPPSQRGATDDTGRPVVQKRRSASLARTPPQIAEQRESRQVSTGRGLSAALPQTEHPRLVAQESAPLQRVWKVQVYAARKEDEAAARIEKLAAAGYSARTERADLKERGVWYRIRLLGYATREAALLAAKKLMAIDLISDYWILPYGSRVKDNSRTAS